MNFDNSIGIALFSGEPAGAAAIGGQQGSENSVAESPEGSLFQQMISQMLTAKTQTVDAASGNLNPGGQSKSGETGDLLSGLLLLAGGKLSYVGTQDKNTGETAEIMDASGEKQKTGENAEAMELLQSLMAGMASPASAANAEKAFQVIRNGNRTESQLTAINSIGPSSANPTDAEILTQTANLAPKSSLTETAASADGKKALAETTEGSLIAQPMIQQTPEEQKLVPQTGSRLEAAVLSRGKATAEKGAAPRESENTIPTNGETESQKVFEPLAARMAEPGSGKQMAVSGSLIQEEYAAPVEKLKQETEAADGTDPVQTGFQNSIQGSVTTSDIPESGMTAQAAEGPQPYSQIREEILSRLEQNGPTEFKMQLEPEDLGQIDIKLKLSEGKLVIDILAADTKTQALLTGQVDKLISSMGLQNVQVESVQVSQQMNSQTQDNSQSQGFSMNSAMDFSQRRHQEQNRQEFFNNGNLAGAFSLQQDEAEKNKTMNRIESIRFDSHRMNYSV